MSDPKMMPVTEAQEWVAYDKSTRPTPRAARTIVHQAEQIETLSRLLSGAEEAAIERAEQIERLQRAVNYAVINSLQDAFDLVVDGVLHPEDMEAPA